MKKTIKLAAYAVAALALTFTACKKDKKTDPAPAPTPVPTPNPQEVITTMKVLIFNGTVTTTYQFKDPDGDVGSLSGFYGPGTASTSTQADSVINLVASKNYTVNLLLLDETKTPVDTISKEVLAEGADHMFFFNQASPIGAVPNTSLNITGTNLTIKYLDNDGATTPRAIGLTTEWITGMMTTTKKELKITLRHQPGVKNGTYAPGETDVEIPFKIKIN